MTKRGYGIAALAAGTYLAGRVLGTHELYLLAFVFAALVLLAQIVVTLSGAGLFVSRSTTPSPPEAGKPASLVVAVQNRTFAPATPSRLHMDLREAAGVEVHLDVSALAPRAEEEHAVDVARFRRGVFALPAPRIESVDPLGLARRSHEVGEETALTVLPAIAPLDSCVFFGGRGRGQDPRTRAALAHASFDLRGVRPHQPGEALSRIDWKSTAKTGSLMLRETEEHTRSAVVLILDGTETVHVGPRGDDTLELSISVLGSIGSYLLREGLAVKLLLHSAHPEEASLEPGDRGMLRLLTTLARVEPSGDRPVSSTMRAFRSSIAGGISVVLATPALDRALLMALTGLADHGTPAYLLHIDTAGFRDEHEFIATDKRKLLLSLEMQGVPSLTIRPEHDLATVLSATREVRAAGGVERAVST